MRQHANHLREGVYLPSVPESARFVTRHDLYGQRERSNQSESFSVIHRSLLPWRGQMKAAGEMLKNSPNAFAFALLIPRFPLTTSETIPFEPKIGTRSACLRPFAAINSCKTSRGVAFSGW